MKISQVNTQQTNFKSGLVAKAGAVEDLLAKTPNLWKELGDCVVDTQRSNGYDYICFSKGKSQIAAKISDLLGFNLLMRTALTDDCPTTTLDALKKLWGN